MPERQSDSMPDRMPAYLSGRMTEYILYNIKYNSIL